MFDQRYEFLTEILCKKMRYEVLNLYLLDHKNGDIYRPTETNQSGRVFM